MSRNIKISRKSEDKQMLKKIYALGVGHNTPVFIDLAVAAGYEVEGLYHYNSERTGEYDHGYPILGSFDEILANDSLEGKQYLLTMGDIDNRSELCSLIRAKGGEVPTLIHPLSIISSFADISPVGVYISPFTYVQADASIGSNTVLLSHVNISHNTRIGKNCFVAGASVVGAYTEVGDNVFIGQGSLSISGKVKTIGEGAYIGARSLLTHDVPPRAVMAGSPAIIIRYI